MSHRELPSFTKDLPRYLRLIFVTLWKAHGEYVSTDRLVDALYCDDTEGGPLDARQVVYSYVYRLKKEAFRHGWAVHCRRHDGYRLVEAPTASGADDVASGKKALETAASNLARMVGPLAAAALLGSLALETIKLTDIEDVG